jgi:hypothetical protein
MKRIIILLALTAIFAVFAAPVLAQTKECNDEFKSATYSKWYDNRTKDQPVAYQAAKDYLATCTTEDQYSAALKKFVTAYEALTADVTNRKQLDEAIKNKNYPEQMRLGKAILATEPDNVTVHLVMAVAGLSDPALLSESAQYAKKAIELVEAGKPVAPLFTSKDQALAYLNYVLAKSTLKSNPTEAIPYFLKAAKYESDLKKNPQLYLELAGAYGEGPVTKLSEAYRAKNYTVETPESKLEIANINQAIDRQIDALARAAALTTDAANKKAVMDVLTGLYKDRNKSEAGLNELVANVLSKPLPEPPTPITSLPTPTAPTAASQPPASTGATQPGTTGSTKTAGSTGTGTTKPASNNGAATGTGNGTAKPAASPTPKKPRRANHRRG